MNRTLRNYLAALSLYFLTSAALSAASEAAIEHLTVGDQLPKASIRLETGEAVDITEHLNGQPALLVFYRGGWCPFCVKQLAQLNDITDQLAAEGIPLIAISPDLPEKLKGKEKLSNLDYELASDSKMDLSKALGIAFKVDDKTVEKYIGWGIDLEGDSGENHHLLPHPSVFVVDGKGVIQFAHVDANYKKRLSSVDVLSAVKSVSGGR